MIFRGVLIAFGLIIFLFLFIGSIGIPTISDQYLESNSESNEFVAFKKDDITCNIKLTPEVLERLIVYTDFIGNTNKDNFIIKDFSIHLFDRATKREIDRIFTIRIFKLDPANAGFYDEVRLENGLEELYLTSNYRKLDYTLSWQYQLNGVEDFDLELKAVLLDKMTNKELIIDKTFHISNNKTFRIEKFRVH